MSGLDLCSFTIIIDDIVLPDGTTCMAQLGGGGPQSLFGYQCATYPLSGGRMARLGLAAGVGPDVPESCITWLQGIGVDTSGLIMHDRPTPRAWQVFEADGRRTQVWRGKGDPCDELYAMLRPRVDNLPPHFLTAETYHIGLHALYPPLKLLRALREAAHAQGGLLSAEPYTAAERTPTSEELHALLSVVDIFSPNESEAASMVGPAPPLAMARQLLEAAGLSGARVVVVRCGPEGVAVAWREDDGLITQGGWLVPAVPDTRVEDVTGAGNAFCGGFLASLAATRKARRASASSSGTGSSSSNEVGHSVASGSTQGVTHSAVSGSGQSAQRADRVTISGITFSGEELREACVWGNVSSSFMIEERGVPRTPLDQLRERALQRAAVVRGRARWAATVLAQASVGCVGRVDTRPSVRRRLLDHSPQRSVTAAAVVHGLWERSAGHMHLRRGAPTTRQMVLCRPRVSGGSAGQRAGMQYMRLAML